MSRFTNLPARLREIAETGSSDLGNWLAAIGTMEDAALKIESLERQFKIVSETIDRDIIKAAVAEYDLEHALDSIADTHSRRAAIRGMMVRLNLYDQFNKALMEEIEK